MKGRIQVITQLPSYAHSDIPGGEQFNPISTHINSKRGIFNAIKSVEEVNAQYTRTPGNAAARQVRIRFSDRD